MRYSRMHGEGASTYIHRPACLSISTTCASSLQRLLCMGKICRNPSQRSRCYHATTDIVPADDHQCACPLCKRCGPCKTCLHESTTMLIYNKCWCPVFKLKSKRGMLYHWLAHTKCCKYLLKRHAFHQLYPRTCCIQSATIVTSGYHQLPINCPLDAAAVTAQAARRHL